MSEPESSTSRRWGGLLVRRSLWLPSWKLVAVLLLGGGLSAGLVLKELCVFLSQNLRVGGPVMVMEGWPPDFVSEAAIAEFRKGGYQRILVTGGAISVGRQLAEWKTYAEVGASTLVRNGMPPEQVLAIPGRRVDRDRTYDSALVLREWMSQHGGLPASIQLVTYGPHSRRSCLLFQRAFGSATKVGVIAVADPAYPAERWWINSVGFREVIAETVAYVYARFFFHAPSFTESAEAGTDSNVKH